jgi:hypothetical protein
MFTPGDIVEFYSAIAGYPKYHLCVLDCSATSAAMFLFINSESGFEGDFVCEDNEFECLPKSPTGQSVISCAQLVRANARQLFLFDAKKIGEISPSVARKLETFIPTATALTKAERQIVLKALAGIK